MTSTPESNQLANFEHRGTTKHVIYEHIRNLFAKLFPPPIVQGTEHLGYLHESSGDLKATGAIFAVSGHNGHLDHIKIREALPPVIRDRLVILYKGQYWEKTWLDHIRPIVANSFPLKTGENVSIKEMDEQIETCAELVNLGYYVCIYVEGGREPEDTTKPIESRRYEPGAAAILAKAFEGTPLFPMALLGMEKWMRKGDKIPQLLHIRRSQPKVIIAEPIIKENLETENRFTRNQFRKQVTQQAQSRVVKAVRDFMGKAG